MVHTSNGTQPHRKKGSKLLVNLTTRMNPKDIVYKKSLSQRVVYFMFQLFLGQSQKDKTVVMENRPAVARDDG